MEPTLPESEIGVLLAGHARFLREERALAASTTAAYVLGAATLRDRVRPRRGPGPASHRRRDAGSVTRGGRGVGWLGTVLRGGFASFLRYGYLSGLIGTDLPRRRAAASDRPGPAARRCHQHEHLRSFGVDQLRTVARPWPGGTAR